MFRATLVTGFFLSVAALAGGVLRLTEVSTAGEVEFRPRIDRAALTWYVERAVEVIDEARGDAPIEGVEQASLPVRPAAPE